MCSAPTPRCWPCGAMGARPRRSSRARVRSERAEAVRTRFALLLLVELGGPLTVAPAAASAASACGASGKHTVCVDAPDVLTGNALVHVTNAPDIGQVIVDWAPDGASATRILTDAGPSPETDDYSFTWPTTKYLDASGTLSVHYANTKNAAVSIRAT